MEGFLSLLRILKKDGHSAKNNNPGLVDDNEWCIVSSANALILLSSGRTTLPRSGLSFRLNSAHLSASLANNVASSSGQSGTAGSSI
ncbi:hypothetical protein NC651_017452 [Populus alba x Populus x berolinensis]|nr:hypothetical protein NC651_017452 [Populus alba x Populus x berolinensis]